MAPVNGASSDVSAYALPNDQTEPVDSTSKPSNLFGLSGYPSASSYLQYLGNSRGFADNNSRKFDDQLEPTRNVEANPASSAAIRAVTISANSQRKAIGEQFSAWLRAAVLQRDAYAPSRDRILSFGTAAKDAINNTAVADPADPAKAGPLMDPRFASLNNAIHSGNGEESVSAAKFLIANLQSEKPPNARLLNEARLSLTVGHMLQGDFDSASKALLAVDPEKLDEAGKDQCTQLGDLLKEVGRASFSANFQAAVDSGPSRTGQAKAAASEAGKLVVLLQKTEPGNTAAITEAKLKQANALLVGNDYRGAEKVLNDVNEKLLDPDHKEYLDALRGEMQAQQTNALGRAINGDMRRKDFKAAVSDSTALVNDLTKYFPDDKSRIVSARLQQATAQIMNGEMDSAGQTLSRISPQDLKAMPEGAQKVYGQLDGAIKENLESAKKERALEAEREEFQKRLGGINTLTASGDKKAAQQAVADSGQLLADVQQKFPNNPNIISGVKLTLANAKIAAGDLAGAKTDLQKLAGESNNASVKDNAQFLLSRVAMKEGHVQRAAKILVDLSQNASTEDLRKGARDVVISIERDQMRLIGAKANAEKQNLRNILDDKRSGNVVSQFVSMPSHPLSAMDEFEADQNKLDRTFDGSIAASLLMKNHNLTLGEIQKTSHADLLKLEGNDSKATADLELFLQNPDAKLVAGHHFDEDDLSWQNGSLYCDPSYLDSSLQKISHWVGDQVRNARSYDEELKASDSMLKKSLGWFSSLTLDGVSAANQFTKDKLKTAADFYNDPERKDTWYAKLGRAGTWGGDMLTSVFTMPATIVDYKATDQEREGAILGTVAMAATAGIIKGGGPAWAEARSLASRVGGRVGVGLGKVAASDIGQWVAKSKFVQTIGRGAVAAGDTIEDVAAKTTRAAQKMNDTFEATSFARGMDRVGVTLGKLNPTLGTMKPGTAKTVDEFMDGALADKTPAELKASVTERDIDNMRRSLSKRGINAPDDEIRRMVLGKKLYKSDYNPAVEPKPASISQETYERQLEKYRGPVKDDDYWHRRYNKPGAGEIPANVQTPDWFSGDIRRFYFNVQPDSAAQLADFMADGLNRRGIKFQYKMPKDIDAFDRADSAVLYVPRENYAAVKSVVRDFALKHPEALSDGSPAFTKSISKGIAAADEPLQANLPSVPDGMHSFGTARSHIAAEAIMDAAPNATKEELKQMVRDRLRDYGFNPDKPWLRQYAAVDDL